MMQIYICVYMINTYKQRQKKGEYQIPSVIRCSYYIKYNFPLSSQMLKAKGQFAVVRKPSHPTLN